MDRGEEEVGENSRRLAKKISRDSGSYKQKKRAKKLIFRHTNL